MPQVRVGTRRVSVSDETYATLEAWSNLTAARLGHKPSVDGAATSLIQVHAPGLDVLGLHRTELAQVSEILEREALLALAREVAETSAE